MIKKSLSMILSRKLIKFGFAGMAATFFSYLCLPLLYNFFRNLDFYFIYILSCALNMLVSFLLQKYFVFNSKKDFLSELSIFTFFALVIMIAGYFFLNWLINIIGMNVFFANMISVTIAAIISFLVHSFFTFNERKI